MNEPLRCPKCGRMVPDNELICKNCWTVLPINTDRIKQPNKNEPSKNDSIEIFSGSKCKKCNADLPLGVKKCPQCGKSVKSRKGILWIILLITGAIVFLTWMGNGKSTSEPDLKPDQGSMPNTSSNIDSTSKPDFNSESSTTSKSNSDAKPASDSESEDTPITVKTPDFTEADKLRDSGKEKITVDETVPEGMRTLREAISLYIEEAEKAGDTMLVSDQIEDTYASYEAAMLKHKSMMESSLSGGIYAQIMNEFNDAVSLGEDLASKGYAINASFLTETRDAFDKEYKKCIAEEFNRFTQRDMWSRTEAWKLISDTADNMFDPANLDDPIRLRYVYALSWWIQKQLETEIGNGTITEKGAAVKIANQIEEMDYNPMMLHYYITYMNHSGEDCSEVEKAYQDIVDYLAKTQGIRLGEDIMLDRFWYFNDFENYPVDSKNGVTPENRQWIRERMKSVSFTK